MPDVAGAGGERERRSSSPVSEKRQRSTESATEVKSAKFVP
jgi:hypothetical protein